MCGERAEALCDLKTLSLDITISWYRLHLTLAAFFRRKSTTIFKKKVKMFGGELVNESEGEGFLKSKTFQKWTFFLDPPSLLSVPSVSKEHHRTIVCSRCYLTYFLYTAHKMVYGQHNTNMAVTLGGHSLHIAVFHIILVYVGETRKKNLCI